MIQSLLVILYQMGTMTGMQIIRDPIPLGMFKQMAEAGFGDMVKAVVDVERRIMAVDAELHADEEALLLEDGSRPADLWGINIYPDLEEADRIEFDSMINIRPRRNNPSRSVQDAAIREHILEIVRELLSP